MKLKIKSPKYGEHNVFFDKCDLKLVNNHTWRIRKHPKSKTYYAVTNIKGVAMPMHRLIMGNPFGKEIDHKDRFGLNNTRANLREATEGQNSFNKPKRSDNTTGYKGVFFCKATGRYRATLRANGKYYRGGRFNTAVEAAKKYNELALKHHKDFACLNAITKEAEDEAAKFIRPAKRRKSGRNHKTGYIGVYQVNDSGRRFRVLLFCNNKAVHVGYYKGKEDAAKAYDEAAIKHIGITAPTNYAV